MRISLRFIFLGLFVQVTFAVTLWCFLRSYLTSDKHTYLLLNDDPNEQQYNKSTELLQSSVCKDIDCVINGAYRKKCKKVDGEVYIPFTFIQDYFEIYGKLTKRNGVEQLNWSHSYASIYPPKEKYDPRGAFTYFQNYRVEERDRVKCITASEGVPISTQWNPEGYYYPTQIAQFGLSHYSKNLTNANSKVLILEDGEFSVSNWVYSASKSILKRTYDPTCRSDVLHFLTSNKDSVVLHTNITEYPVLTVDLKLQNNVESSFIVTVVYGYTQQIWNLCYDCSARHIHVEGNSITHGMNCSFNRKWKRLTRDLFIDLQKGIIVKTKSKIKIYHDLFAISKITLKGIGELDNLTVSTGHHVNQFYDAANWFVRHQDNVTGGWPIPVTRKMAGILRLSPGWYSAMGQGHGLSLLSRAYYHSGGDEKYLLTALKALRPFQVSSKSGGVLAMYLNEVPWYEEYPTDPPTFVLNGFMYALIGLYDLLSVIPTDIADDAEMLFNQGMDSLKTLLLAYDTGSGTTYDLRHLTLGIAPKLARWDYHATHINQLLLLATIDKSPLFSITAKRWLGYMRGKRASHN